MTDAPGDRSGPSDDGDASPVATVALSDGSMTLTVDDGRMMRDALVSYCSDHDCADIDVDRLTASGVEIDPDGVLRVGAWYVDSHFGECVLVHRRRVGDAMLMWVARLSPRTGGGWSVRALDHEVVERR